MRLRQPRRRLDLPVRDPGPAVGDVGGHRVAEEIGFLEDEGDLRPQAAERRVANVDPVDHHSPALRVIEARDQVDQRALARSRRPDDGDDAVALHLEVHIVKDGLVGRIAEGEVFKLDRARPRRQRPRVRLLGHRRWRGQHLVQAPRRHDRVLVLLVDRSHLLESRQDRTHRGAEDHDVAGVQLPLDHQHSDRPEQRQVRRGGDRADDRCKVREHRDPPQCALEVAVRVGVVLVDLQLFGRKRLDDVHAGDVFGDDRDVFVPRLHHELVRRLDLGTESHDVPGPDGQRDQRQRRQPGISRVDDDDVPADDQHDLQREQEPLLHEGAHVVEVRQRAVDELPGADRVVETKADALEFVVYRLADVEDQRHAQLRLGHDAKVAQQEHDGRERDQHDEQVAQRQGRIVMDQRVLERLPSERRGVGEPEPEAVRRAGPAQLADVIDDVAALEDGELLDPHRRREVEARQEHQRLDGREEAEHPEEQLPVAHVLRDRFDGLQRVRRRRSIHRRAHFAGPALLIRGRIALFPTGGRRRCCHDLPLQVKGANATRPRRQVNPRLGTIQVRERIDLS